MFDYEGDLFKTLMTHRFVWVKKATGLGITEFMLRYIVWLALKDDALNNAQVCIVTGPNWLIGKRLIGRAKGLFPDFPFPTGTQVLNIMSTEIAAFPSHHMDAMRALENVKLVFLDEADFFPEFQQTSVRGVSERYIGKSRADIVMVSTPNLPGGLFDRMEQEEESMYKRVVMDYTYGVNKIYTSEDIELAKLSPEFQREYCGRYGYNVGNVFLPEHIERALELGKEHFPQTLSDYNPSKSRALGIDPAFGSSAFAFVITEVINGIITVLYAQKFTRPDYEAMVSLAYSLMHEYKIDRVFTDGSNRALWTSLKNVIGESVHSDDEIYESDTIVPVNFGTEHRNMLTALQSHMSNGYLAVHPQFTELVHDLRVARTNELGKVVKEGSNQLDLFDALRLCSKHYIQY